MRVVERAFGRLGKWWTESEEERLLVVETQRAFSYFSPTVAGLAAQVRVVERVEGLCPRDANLWWRPC